MLSHRFQQVRFVARSRIDALILNPFLRTRLRYTYRGAASHRSTDRLKRLVPTSAPRRRLRHHHPTGHPRRIAATALTLDILMVRDVRHHMLILLIVAKRPLFLLLRLQVEHQLLAWPSRPLLQHIYVTGDSLGRIGPIIFGGSQEVIPADWPFRGAAVPGAFGIGRLLAFGED